MQCITRDVDGKREVAGVHWDYDCYGAPGKIAQVRLAPNPSCPAHASSILSKTASSVVGLRAISWRAYVCAVCIHTRKQGPASGALCI